MSAGIALLLGLVQGLTEFLPISSSGHLILLPYLFGWQEVPHPLLFDLMLHVATLLAVVLYFRCELASVLRSLARKPTGPGKGEGVAGKPEPVARAEVSADPLQGQGRKVLQGILISLLPLPAVALFSDWVEGAQRRPLQIALELTITGCLCWAVDRLAQRAQRSWQEMNRGDGFWMGVAQAVAALPAISRSGTTIAMGLWRGLQREVAARFSFLISVPAILGATLWEARGLQGGGGVPLSAYLIGMVISFVSGYLALALLFRVLRQGRFRYFGVYCWGLAAILVLKWALTRS